MESRDQREKLVEVVLRSKFEVPGLHRNAGHDVD